MRRKIFGLFLVIGAILSGLATGHVAEAATYTSTFSASPSTVVAGGSTNLTVNVTSSVSETVLVDLEVHSATAGAFQQAWDNQALTAGVAKSFTTTWNVPANTAPGQYTMKVGVFGPGWSSFLYWDNYGPTITVTVAPPPTTTTTVPVTTTTVPVTTTTAPPATTTTTTAPATTTTTAPATTTTTQPTTTTTAPPSTSCASVPNAQFVECFDTSTAFATRFHKDLGNYVTADGFPMSTWGAQGNDTPHHTHGDHDMNCGSPSATERVLDNWSSNWMQHFWDCFPGDDPAKGHLMTGFDTSGYAVVSFSPKQVMNNVQRVCWSVNATDEGGGKWTNMVVVPHAVFENFKRVNYPNRQDFNRASTSPYRMDYVRGDFNSPNAPGDFNLQAPDYGHLGSIFGIADFRGQQIGYVTGSNVDVWEIAPSQSGFVTTDKAARYKHCATESAAGVVLTVARPNGTTSTYTLAGKHFPTGAVHVIFQDEMYNPPKREGYNERNTTWHWDDIQIS